MKGGRGDGARGSGMREEVRREGRGVGCKEEEEKGRR